MTITDPMPFAEALGFVEQKEAMPTTLSSREISRLSSDLKRRSFFSARVTLADFLQKAQDLTAKIAGGLSEGGATAGTQAAPARTLSIPEAKAQLAELLDGIGYQARPGEEGTIKDLRTDARLQLVVETNVLDALGAGRHTAMQDPVALDVNPAWELVRMIEPRGAARDWPSRWDAARAASTADGATDSATGRMVALKNHPIWEQLGSPDNFDDALGNPWPPFAFNSGMNVIDVPRDEAVALGLLGSDTVVPPVDGAADLASGVEIDGTRFDASMREALKDAGLSLVQGVFKLAA